MAQGFLKYGAMWPKGSQPIHIELACIKMLGKWTNKRGERCGKGLPYHVLEAMKILWPEMYVHRWTELMVETFLSHPGRTGIIGPSSSQKSCTISRASLVMFYARPKGTTVLISSTTRDALTRRVWDYVVSSDRAARKLFDWLPGSLIESKLMLLADPSNTDGRSLKDGIIGVALKSGGQWQGIENLVGAKNDVMIVVCDELSFCPPGIVDSLANLESNEKCYFLGMGNLPDVHNSLGKLCEPKGGWDGLPDTDKTRVFETKWTNGRAIQLIGMDSPNLDFPAGEEPYKNLIGRRYIEQCAENYGRESDKFNMFASGKIPRTSMDRTVFTKAQCMKFNATGPVTWGHQSVVRGYGLDAAYSGIGGDRTAGAPFIFGKDVRGMWKFWLGPIKVYCGSDTSTISHSAAIAMQVKQECEAHGIPPEHMFYDGTGRSELTIEFARHWSSKVIPLEFGGVATERPAFTGERFMDGDKKGDQKQCKDVFDRFVTELWFALRHCILADQMRGMSDELIEEGSQRKWEMVRGSKYCIETKSDMKERGLRSPDLCDCAVVAIEGARRLGFPLGVSSIPTPKPKFRWLESMAEKEWTDIKSTELQTV